MPGNKLINFLQLIIIRQIRRIDNYKLSALFNNFVFLLNGNKALISQVTNFLISTHAVVRISEKLYNSAHSRGKGTVPKYDNDQAEDSYRRFTK